MPYLCVLCVDDEPAIRAVLAIALGRDPQIRADIVASGVEGLELASRNSYDLILLDGCMPGLDGYAVCERLKQNPVTAAVPVVFLTADTDSRHIMRALTCGAVAAIAKPFDPLTLAAEVRRVAGV